MRFWDAGLARGGFWVIRCILGRHNGGLPGAIHTGNDLGQGFGGLGRGRCQCQLRPSGCCGPTGLISWPLRDRGTYPLHHKAWDRVETACTKDKEANIKFHVGLYRLSVWI